MITVIVLCPAWLAAQEPEWVPAHEENLPLQVFAVRKNAERLQSGEYTAKGRRRVVNFKILHGSKEEAARHGRSAFERNIRPRLDNPEQRRSLDQPRDRSIQAEDYENRENYRLREYDEEIESAFDYETRRLAFRRRWEQTSGDVMIHSRRREWYIGTPDYTILVRGHERPDVEVAIRLPMKSAIEIHRALDLVIDARSMGWGSVKQLGNHFGKDFLAHLGPDEVRLVDEGSGIYRLEAFRQMIEDPEAQGILWTWWLDENQGFQPVRFVHRNHFRNPSKRWHETSNRIGRFNEEAELSWTQINGVWVPQNVDMRGEYLGTFEQFQLTFEWKSVNEPVGDHHFDWQSWNLPEHSRVVDLRMGEDKPILVE